MHFCEVIQKGINLHELKTAVYENEKIVKRERGCVCAAVNESAVVVASTRSKLAWQLDENAREAVLRRFHTMIRERFQLIFRRA